MAFRSPGDELTYRPARILVAGTSGSGKTTLARDRWVTEWQYRAVRPLLADRADLLVVLDLPRWRVMTRITRRTLSRRLRRTELWNGNLESPLHTVLRDPDHIIRFAWRTHADNLPRVAELMERAPSLPVVRLSTPAEVDRWLTGPLTRAAAMSRYRAPS